MPDVVIADTDVRFVSGQNPQSATWGEAVAAGQPVRINSSDNRYYLADNLTQDDASVDAVAVTSGAAGQQGLVVPKNTTISVSSVLTRGVVYYVSANPGRICPESDLITSVNEVQSIEVNGATAGTFTITFDGQTTAGIAFDASAADIKAALEALSNIDTVEVSGGPIGTAAVAVEFQGVNRRKDVPEMTLNTAGLTGTITSSVTTTTAGVAGSYVSIVGYAESETNLRLLVNPTDVQR